MNVPARVSRYIRYAAGGCAGLLLAAGLAGSSITPPARSQTFSNALNSCLESYYATSLRPVGLQPLHLPGGYAGHVRISFDVKGNQQVTAAFAACWQKVQAIYPGGL